MKRSILLLLLLFTQLALADNYTFLGSYKGHQAQKSGVGIATTNRTLSLSFFKGGVVKVQVGEPKAPSYLELNELSPVSVKIQDDADKLTVEFPGGHAEISKNPVRVSIFREDGSLVLADDPGFGHGWDGKEVRVWKTLNDDHRFFGLGEKTGDVNKRGRFFTNWNADTPAYRNDTDPLYCGIPFFSGTTQGRAFGLFFPNSYRSTFNLGSGNKRLFSFGAEDGDLVYYVFTGPTMKEVIQHYTQLTGRMPLPPKWALGYQQCRWSYYPEYEVRDIAKEFRQRKIPADVLYFDIHYMDAYKVFTWHPERFPNPEQLLSDLQDQGFKTVTIIDPGVKVEKGYPAYEEGVAQDHFLKFLDGELFQGQVWPGWCHFPDFRKAATRAWWGSKNAGLRAMGIDGFWNDMNEPALWGKEMPFTVEGIKSLHNVFALLMAQATFEGLVKDNPKLRPFIVTRAGWAGIQRFAAVWTGDNSASYDDLALSIRTNIGLGLSGVPFVGCDVGGFVGQPDPELYVRWMQAAALSPFMRSHTVHDTPDQEPWSYGEETERRCREAIELRYKLMPYLYSELHRATETGLPMYRPVWLEFPNDEAAYQNDYQHQFMLGPNLLAAPVLRQGQRFQKVYLPAGQWFEPTSGTLHKGGAPVLVEASLDQLPLFYRAGSVVPTREVQQYIDQSPLRTLELTAVPGSNGSYRMTTDDGLTRDGAQQHSLFTLRGDRLKIELPRAGGASSIQRLKVRVAGLAEGAEVAFNGQKARVKDGWVIFTADSGVLSW